MCSDNQDIKIKGRIDYIDLAKGICILLVVLSHVLDDCYSIEYPFQRLLEPIRMPFYFILSGLFFKTYDGWFSFFKKKINKILIPYWAFYLIYLIIDMVVAPHAGEWAHGWGAPLWFLMCLFMMNIGFCTMKTLIKNDWVLYFCVLLVGVVGSHTQWLPLRISPATTCLPFFAFGYWLRNNTNFLQQSYSILTLLSIWVIIGISTYLWGARCGYCSNEYGMHISALYFCGTIGTVGMLLIAKKIKKLPFVSYVGRYSLIVLVTHYMFLKTFRPLVDLLIDNIYCRAFVLYIIVVLFSALMIYPLKKLVPFLVAQTDLLK